MMIHRFFALVESVSYAGLPVEKVLLYLYSLPLRRLDCGERFMASAVQPIDPVRITPLPTAIWRGSGSVWSLADDERHLGHIVRAGDSWLAFDATHVNESGTGFRLLGCCRDIAQARSAVEQIFEEQAFKSAGSRTLNRNDRPVIFTLQ
jgi:hypothetical protein